MGTATGEDLDLSLLYAVSPFGASYWPNFDAPPPTTPHPDIGEEIERVAASPHREVVRDIELTYPAGPPPDARPFVDDPAAALRGLANQMRVFWDAVIGPQWRRVTAILEAEIALRARRLVATGSVSAFEDLDPSVTWHGDELPGAPHRESTGRRRPRWTRAVADPLGLRLGRVAAHRPAVGPRSDLPAARDRRSLVRGRWPRDALDALIGQRRATILRSLDRPPPR